MSLTILDLPNELLLDIAEFLSDPKSINYLLRTNKRLASLLTPNLQKLALLDRKDGTPALHWSITRNHLPLFKFILREITPKILDRRDRLGQTALHCAAISRRGMGFFGPLVSGGADVCLRDYKYNTILHMMVNEYCPSIELIGFLIDQGCPINDQSETGSTALHIAAKHGSLKVIKLLLSKGAKISFLDNCGETVLHVATRLYPPHIRLINFLIDKECPVDAQSGTGSTALHIAAGNCYGYVVERLLSKGANVSLWDNNHQTVLHAAAGYYRGTGPNVTASHIASSLLNLGVDVNARSRQGYTALIFAVRIGDTTMVELLLGGGATTETTENLSGGTALHWAARLGRCDIGNLLIKSKANVCARDTQTGGTPLHWSTTIDMDKLLLENGANHDILNCRGRKARVHMESIRSPIDRAVE